MSWRKRTDEGVGVDQRCHESLQGNMTRPTALRAHTLHQRRPANNAIIHCSVTE